MDEVIEVIGLAGSCLIGLSFIPQTYKTITTDQKKTQTDSLYTSIAEITTSKKKTC